MKTATLQKELEKYEMSFTAFVDEHSLPAEWFAHPDHFAVKCADRDDYIATYRLLSNVADKEGIWAVDMDGRSLASAKLASRFLLGGFSFEWVEIMQPRPGKETASGYVEHTEFVVPDFTAVEKVLQERGIPFEHQANPGHAWINVVIDDDMREIKFNNLPLEKVVEIEMNEGKLYKVEV